MKKILISAAIVIALVGATFFYLKKQTKSHSPADVVAFQKGDFNMSIYYSRPFKKGRDIFGGLEPYGKVWRTGANEATEIEFNKDINWNGNNIKAGRYALFTIPNQKQWTVILNSELGQWGAFTYDETKDVSRTMIKPYALADTVQQFSIKIVSDTNNHVVRLGWDLTGLDIPFSIP